MNIVMLWFAVLRMVLSGSYRKRPRKKKLKVLDASILKRTVSSLRFVAVSYACMLCHNDANSHHSMLIEATNDMMRMRCRTIQPVGPVCTNPCCNKFPMAKYYCSYCKFFDDEREVYHCPYCNRCQVGNGLAIDYYLYKWRTIYVVKGSRMIGVQYVSHIFLLPHEVIQFKCGHFIHRVCYEQFQHAEGGFRCPVCSKNVVDMTFYNEMIDRLKLMTEGTSSPFTEGYHVDISCIECGEAGRVSPSGQLNMHKCPSCGSYNTRLA